MAKIPSNSEQRMSFEFKQRIIDFIDYCESNIKQFAFDCHVNKEVITRAAIYGIIPSTKSLINIADYLQTSLDYLLCETEDSNFYKSEQPTTFAIRLEELKTARNVKYAEIAKTMPFSQAHFHDWLKKGYLPSLEYLNALAEYFNVRKDYLLGRTDEKD